MIELLQLNQLKIDIQTVWVCQSVVLILLKPRNSLIREFPWVAINISIIQGRIGSVFVWGRVGSTILYKPVRSGARYARLQSSRLVRLRHGDTISIVLIYCGHNRQIMGNHQWIMLIYATGVCHRTVSNRNWKHIFSHDDERRLATLYVAFLPGLEKPRFLKQFQIFRFL